jgi:phosphatidylglycerol:prolipoprotein diacylglycerol transferase
MHPVLFSIFNFPIHSYGFMLALSFLFAIWLSSRRAKNRGLDPNAITDVGFYVILAAIIGARLYYVFLHFDEFQNDLVAIFNPFHRGSLGIGGLVMYGGFIGALLAGYIYLKAKKLSFWAYADVIAPSFAFGEFLTRIGCFMNGCCYGAQTHSHLGVIFPADSPAGVYQAHVAAQLQRELGHVAGVHLYPSQLFLSAGALLIGFIILLAGRKKMFTGFEFCLTVILMSVLRFIVDFTRFYTDSERLGGLSHNQLVCIALFIIFGGLILRNVISAKELPVPVAATK